jgi:DNA invertase Pin-like site-specific DNA recombinase
MARKQVETKRRMAVRRAYSYIRFSTPEQLKGDSLRRQLEASEDYARRHNLVLDDSLQLRDLGISAFRGKNLREGALAAFVEAVSLGKVPVGSVLIVESLDRISRDEIGEALSLFISILNRGIQIATITPERLYTKQSINDVAGILEAIIYMARAHEESSIKSQRLKKAWEGKRRTIDSKKLTARCPAWIRLNKERTRYEPVPTHVATVKRIFQLAADGQGVNAICKLFSETGVPPIGRATCWHKSFIMKTLRNRSVLGEYQPCIGHASNRTPIGDPLPHYYPRVISDALWAKVQSALTIRKTQRGPHGDRVRNLFTGLIRDARDGSTMTLVDKGKRGVGPQLVSSAATRGEPGSKYASFPCCHLEDALLRWTKELSPDDLLPEGDHDQAADELAIAEGRLAEVREKIERCKQRLMADTDFDALLDVLSRLESEAADVAARRDRLQQEMHAKRPASLRDSQQLIGALKRAEGDDVVALRLRLRAKLRRIIEEIWMLIIPRAKERIALLQVHLAGGHFRKLAIHVQHGQPMVWHEVQRDSAHEQLLGVDLRKLRSRKAIPKAWR